MRCDRTSTPPLLRLQPLRTAYKHDDVFQESSGEPGMGTAKARLNFTLQRRTFRTHACRPLSHDALPVRQMFARHVSYSASLYEGLSVSARSISVVGRIAVWTLSGAREVSIKPHNCRHLASGDQRQKGVGGSVFPGGQSLFGGHRDKWAERRAAKTCPLERHRFLWERDCIEEQPRELR